MSYSRRANNTKRFIPLHKMMPLQAGHWPLVALVALLYFSSTSAEPKRRSHEKESGEQPQGKLDEFVDYILSAFRKMVVERKLQPFPIPDIRKRFSKRPLGMVRISGEASLFNGSIAEGLETVTRSGPTNLSTKRYKRGTKRKLSVEFELKDVVVNENFKLKLLKMGPKGGLEIKMDHIKMYVEMVITTRSHRGNNNINVKLGKVDIVEFSPFVFSLSGLGPLNMFVKLFTSIIAKLCRQAILRSIWSAVQQLMTQVINDTTADSSLSLVSMLMKFL